MSFSGHCRTCGCSAPTLSSLPRSTYNRPGLPALNFRVGTHPAFLATMQTRLSSTSNSELAGLMTRETSDSSMALLDAWATVSDVLTFYQERIANEGYLRTATERRSVLEQAREIGYELAPGVAASTYLAFTVEDAPSAPKQALVPVGTKVQSVPGPGEQPQVFE